MVVKFLLQNNGLSLQVFCIEKNLSVVMILSSVGFANPPALGNLQFSAVESIKNLPISAV